MVACGRLRLGWFNFSRNTFGAQFGLSMGEENPDRGRHFERGTSEEMQEEREGRVCRGGERKGKEEGERDALLKREHTHTEDVGKTNPLCGFRLAARASRPPEQRVDEGVAALQDDECLGARRFPTRKRGWRRHASQRRVRGASFPGYIREFRGSAPPRYISIYKGILIYPIYPILRMWMPIRHPKIVISWAPSRFPK